MCTAGVKLSERPTQVHAAVIRPHHTELFYERRGTLPKNCGFYRKEQLNNPKAQHSIPPTRTTTCHLILNYHQRIKQGGCPHLSQCALSLNEFTEHKQGDEEQGDRGNEPAQDVGPQRVNVSAAELQRGVFDDGEDERALGWRETQRIQVKPIVHVGCACTREEQREKSDSFTHACTGQGRVTLGTKLFGQQLN